MNRPARATPSRVSSRVPTRSPRRRQAATGSAHGAPLSTWLTWLALLVVLVVLVVVMPGAEGRAVAATPEDTAAPLPAVRVATVRHSAATANYRFPGTVRARERAAPAFLHAGVLRERPVTRGQRVAAGEVLATLHHPALAPALAAAEARVGESEARLRRLERDLARVRTLRARNLSAADELDRLEAERDAAAQARAQARAQRDEAAAQLAELTLRAPFTGVVSELLAQPGEFIAAGQPVVRLVGDAGREVALHLPAGLAARLAVGQAATLNDPVVARRYPGRVAEVGRADGGLVPVIVALDPAGGGGEDDERETERAGASAPLLGASVQVTLALAAAPRLEVPLTAVVDAVGAAPQVLVVTDSGRVRRAAIRPGRLADGWVSIVAPELAPGDRVVVAGHGRLAGGERVRVLP